MEVPVNRPPHLGRTNRALRDPSEFAGLCFMGGPMSVNDPLPSLRRAETLIRESLSLDRFRTGWAKLMLPFRMPRRAG